MRLLSARRRRAGQPVPCVQVRQSRAPSSDPQRRPRATTTPAGVFDIQSTLPARGSPARARAPRSLAATWARCFVPVRGATSRRRAAASAPRREAPKRKITRVYAPWRLRGQRIHAAIVSAQHLKISADTLKVEPSRTSPCDGMRQTAPANAKRRAIGPAQRGSSARTKVRCTAAAEKFAVRFLFLNSAPTMRLWQPHAAPTSSQCYRSMRFRWHDVRRRRGRQFARAVDVFGSSASCPRTSRRSYTAEFHSALLLRFDRPGPVAVFTECSSR